MSSDGYGFDMFDTVRKLSRCGTDRSWASEQGPEAIPRYGTSGYRGFLIVPSFDVSDKWPQKGWGKREQNVKVSGFRARAFRRVLVSGRARLPLGQSCKSWMCQIPKLAAKTRSYSLTPTRESMQTSLSWQVLILRRILTARCCGFLFWSTKRNTTE